MRRIAAAAALITLTGCTAEPWIGNTPTLLRFQPPALGGPTLLPEASPSGTVDLSGPCVRLDLAPGMEAILISTHEASVGRDSQGLYLGYRGRRFRHGDWVKGGGGYYDRLPVDPLQGPVPEACSEGPFLILYGLEQFQPPSELPQSPPPPTN